MRIPYGYHMGNNEFIICQEKAEVVPMIYYYYLSGASLGKVANMLSEERIPSPTGKEHWTRAAIDKLLSNAKYIPIVGVETYMNVQFEKEHNSVCQWNQFLKDFFLDEFSDYYSNKLKVAAILWKEVRDSKNKKIYLRELLSEYAYKIEEYCK